MPWWRRLAFSPMRVTTAAPPFAATCSTLLAARPCGMVMSIRCYAATLGGNARDDGVYLPARGLTVDIRADTRPVRLRPSSCWAAVERSVSTQRITSICGLAECLPLRNRLRRNSCGIDSGRRMMAHRESGGAPAPRTSYNRVVMVPWVGMTRDGT